ncbi:MAG: hypothetical protein GX817_00505 [Elusimicrobia bacterium]|nr:hypothetical protein [Elusimicrobiota bacterium]
MLISRGANRSEAIARMSRALDEFEIGGVDTVIDFHKLLLENNNFLRASLIPILFRRS